MTNREIDALVAEKVMGWTRIPSNHPYRWYNDRGGVIVEGQPQKFPCYDKANATYGGIPDDWRPSSSIAAAWEVVEKLSGPDFDHRCVIVSKTDMTDEKWGCEIGNTQAAGSDGASYAVADTAPMAICLAALNAVGVEVPQKGSK